MVTVCICMILKYSAAAIVPPQSVTVVVGGMATFQCAGPGAYLIWKINGQTLVESSKNDGQFVVQRESNLGIWQSNLTVLTASAENNGTIVQCELLGVPPVSSDNATLTVLPGNLTCVGMTESEVELVFV